MKLKTFSFVLRTHYDRYSSSALMILTIESGNEEAAKDQVSELIYSEHPVQIEFIEEIKERPVKKKAVGKRPIKKKVVKK